MKSDNTVPKRYIPSPLKAVLTILAILFLGIAPCAMGVEVSQNPMSHRLNPPPPNAMFVIDNSGSMDWEVMTDENNGLFGVYGYVFQNAGDNAYTTGTFSPQVEVGDPGLWKAQWAGYNRMFYHPHSTYNPWPSKNAVDIVNDLDAVRSNPHYSTPTFDLTAVYQTISEEVIVDNQDGSPSFTTTGTWVESGSPDEWDGSAYYTTTSGGTATFTPNIPTTGTYDVYAWWNSYADRDEAADYTIVHAGGTSTVTRDQGVNGGTWVLLGQYSFNSGTSGSVTVTRTGTNLGDSTLADAVRFVRVASSVTISRAHYYVVYDADGDGQADFTDSDNDGIQDQGETVTEPIYLVNFVYESGAWVRKYYLFTDGDGDNRVENGELTEVTTGIPDSIKPAFYEDDGSFIDFKTDQEDLQNFANWYSFYRRRELAAKAAIATSIVRISRVNVGFYTIHDGARTGVLPVKVPVTGTDIVIVDDQDGGFSRSSNFNGPYNSNSTNLGYGPKYFRTSNNSAWARFTPDIPTTTTYNVYAWWTCVSTNDTTARYTIHHAGGTYHGWGSQPETKQPCRESLRTMGAPWNNPLYFQSGNLRICGSRKTAMTADE